MGTRKQVEGEEGIRIAQISCGTLYGNVQHEIEKAAAEVGAELFVPEVDLEYVGEKVKEFGYDMKKSLGLSVALARGFAVAEGLSDADAAKKRDDSAARLTKDQLKQEKDRIKAFVPTRPVASANEPGNWQNVATRNVLTAPNATRRVP